MRLVFRTFFRYAWFTLDAVNGKRNPRAEFPRVKLRYRRGFSALEFTLDSTEEMPTNTEEVSTEGGSLVHTVVDALSELQGIII